MICKLGSKSLVKLGQVIIIINIELLTLVE